MGCTYFWSIVPLISLTTGTLMYYFHGSLFSLDAFLHFLQDPKTECREERGEAWSYSCQMWILICAGLWHCLAIPIFWHDILHNGCGANLRILKWKCVILSIGPFSWTGCLRLIWCTKKRKILDSSDRILTNYALYTNKKVVMWIKLNYMAAWVVRITYLLFRATRSHMTYSSSS